jgi:16S rRNA (guanine(966)-N(2))-methyltransferase RsmD
MKTTAKKRSQKALRPTTGKVREALFDILRSSIKNARFLDLYAGTGAVGIDALKEGASEAVFVEKSKEGTKKIRDYISKSGFSEKTAIVNRKAISFIEWAEMNDMTFDIIFLDPPYHTDEILDALSTIDKSAIVGDNGTVIAEHFKKRQLPEKFDTLHKYRDYRYGDTVLSFYNKTVQNEPITGGTND